jgi:hypothetical protein
MASDAIAQLDANGNGAIDSEEAKAAPGLAAAYARTDANQDGSLTADEIAQRIETIVSTSPAIVNLVIELSSRGEPVADATVTVVAEGFLGEAFPPGFGTTDEFGIAAMAMAPEDLPFEGAPQGIRPGLYRIEVETGGQRVSPKNPGVEISMDAPTLRTSTFKVEI